MEVLNNNHVSVMHIVCEKGDPTLKDIISQAGLTKEDATLATRQLVQTGLVRMRDDDLEHDWTYVLTTKGREWRDKL